MILTKPEILRRLRLPVEHPERIVIIPPPDDSETNPVHVELNLSEDFIRFLPSRIGSQPAATRLCADEVLLEPGELILCSSSQILGLPPNIIGFGLPRASLNRIGLQMSSLKVEPGFLGRLVMEFNNSSGLPISLHKGMAVSELELIQVDKVGSSEPFHALGPSILAIVFDQQLGTAAFVRSEWPIRVRERNQAEGLLVQPWALDHQAQLPFHALRQFEQMIRDPGLNESDFQHFFEEQDWLLFGSEYTEVKPHLVLEQGEGTSLIPDFFVKPVAEELWDVLEIKRPIENIVVERKNRRRFSSAVYEGVAQLRNYSLFFDDARNREVVKQKYGIVSYRPKLILLIGQHMGIVDPVERQRLRLDFSDVRIVTYDELIKKAKHRLYSDRKWRL